MTIEQYLYGKVDFNLSDTTVAAILYDRGIAEGSDLYNVSEKQRELALADLYMFLSSSAVSSGSKSETDGGWQKVTPGKNVYNREGFYNLAKSIYAKWGEPFTDQSTSVIKFKPLY